MRAKVITAAVLAAVAVALVELIGGGRADAVRGAFGFQGRAQQLDPAAPPLPVVRGAARSIEALRVPGGRALLARTPQRRSDRVVLVAHGRGSLAGTIFARPERARWVADLLSAGWSVATADAGGDAWGNDASVADYRDLAAQLRTRGMDRIVLAGSSMGGLASLRLLRELRPIAYVGIYPVFDLDVLFRLGRFADSIRAAYGFRGDTLPAGARERAPVRLPLLRGLPVLLWASPDDTVVPKASNADRLAAAARAAGGRVLEFSTVGEHGDDSNWDGPRLVRLLGEAAALPGATSARRGAPSRRGP